MRTMIQLMATTCLVASPALAQTAPTPPAPDAQATGQQPAEASPDSGQAKAPAGDIVVTGSRIRRPNAASAAPITSVTSREIQAQAAINVEEVLNRLPQVTPDSQQNYSDSDGRQRIKLRNLGFERTLVLVDGLRLGTQNGQDTGIIPTSLLDRVDVLTGGASSVYGSDAISGVVNFVLKKNYNGVQLNAQYDFYNHDNKDTIVSPIARSYGYPVPLGVTNDGGRSDISLTAGHNFFDDKVNVAAFVDYRHADRIPITSRSSAACNILQTAADGPLTCFTSTTTPYGFVQPIGPGATPGPQYSNNPDGSHTFVPFGPTNSTNYIDTYSAQREDNRINAGGFLNAKISDAFEIYANGLWFRDKSRNLFPAAVSSYTSFGTTPYQVNCNNPFLSASQAAAICGAAAGTSATAPIDVRYRFPLQPSADDVFINTGFRATGGFRGSFGKEDAWHWDVGGVYARNQQDWLPGNYSSVDRVNQSLNVVNVNGVPTCASNLSGGDPACVPFDAFSANNNNPALVGYLVSEDGGRSRTVTQLFDVLATLNGDLGKYGIKSPIANDGVAVALGLEYRKDRLISAADAAFRNLYGGTDANLRVSAKEANIELQAPLVQEQPWTYLLQLNGGYRLSKYSSNDKAFSTYKVEGLWGPIKDITFRASYNKAQRAPSVIEAFQAGNLSYTASGPLDPCGPTRNTDGTIGAPTATIEQCRNTGLPDNLYGSTTLLCPDTGCTVRQGGYQLSPETAYTKTFGVVLRPRFLPGLTLSVDRFLIDLNQSIGFNYSDFYLNGCLATGDPFYCSGIVRNPDGTLNSPIASNPTTGFFRQGTSNFFKSTSHGYDFQGQYTLPLKDAGRLEFLFNGSLTTYAGGQDAPNLLPKNCVGYFGPNCGDPIPKWAHGLRTTYTTPDNVFSASLNWRYVGPLTVTYNSNDPGIGYGPEDVRSTFTRIGAQNYFDLSLAFAIEKGFVLRFGANNLLDKTPPLIPNSYNVSLSRNNTIPQRYDSLGRNLSVGITTSF